jgi:hypothetical protein
VTAAVVAAAEKEVNHQLPVLQCQVEEKDELPADFQT